MLKTGVIGVGHLGRHHARVLNQIEGSRMMGIYDQDASRAKEIGEQLGVTVFETREALFDAVDAVDIAVTTTYHYDIAKAALEAGKHIFVEKPITSELHQAEELVELAEKKKLKLQVGHIERFNPVVLDAFDQIKEPMFIESHRLAPFNPRGSDVPVVLDLMIHDIDLILSFVHSKIRDIRASGVSILTKSIDIANARLEFENGAIANVTSSRVSQKQERKIRLFQRNAYISMDFKEKNVKILKKSPKLIKVLPKIMAGKTDFNPEDLVDIRDIDSNDHPKDALTYELEAFVQAVTKNKTPIVDGKAGTRALRIAFEIMRRIKENTPDFKL